MESSPGMEVAVMGLLDVVVAAGTRAGTPEPDRPRKVDSLENTY
jgi:hypothetical protein